MNKAHKRYLPFQLNAERLFKMTIDRVTAIKTIRARLGISLPASAEFYQNDPLTWESRLNAMKKGADHARSDRDKVLRAVKLAKQEAVLDKCHAYDNLIKYLEDAFGVNYIQGF